MDEGAGWRYFSCMTNETKKPRTSAKHERRIDDTLEGVAEAQAAEIRRLEGELATARGLCERLTTESLVFQAAHAREKGARESWVASYEAAQALVDRLDAVVGAHAEGMDACVTAGPQCHYELPYEACKELLAILHRKP